MAGGEIPSERRGGESWVRAPAGNRPDGDGLGMRGETSNPLSLEMLEEYAPEVILLMPCGFSSERSRTEWEGVRHHPVWMSLPAVQTGTVFVVEGSLFHRPGPRLIDGLELMAGLLHPEISIGVGHEGFAQKVA